MGRGSSSPAPYECSESFTLPAHGPGRRIHALPCASPAAGIGSARHPSGREVQLAGATEDLRAFAAEIGLDLVGVTTPEPVPRLLSELDRRRESYLPKFAPRLPVWERLARPAEVLPGAKSVVVLGYGYYRADPPPPPGSEGRVGRIVAYGHLGVLRAVRSVVRWLERRGHRAVAGIHRKEAAVRAGLGAIGKNGLVLNERFGQWVAYQAVVTDAELEPAEPDGSDPCGDCDLCLRACPTGALVEPGRLDPRRCVTALLTTPDIPEEFREKTGDRLLGCDACLEACPKNGRVPEREGAESVLPIGTETRVPLADLLRLTEDRFRRKVIPRLLSRITGSPWTRLLLGLPLLGPRLLAAGQKRSAGQEVASDTLVHAASSLTIYQRNAILAAANTGATGLRADIERHHSDPALATVVEWALERL